MQSRFLLLGLALILPSPDALAAPSVSTPPLVAPSYDAAAPYGGQLQLREIHFDAGGEDAELQARDVSRRGEWTTICRAPCTTRAPASFAYRVSGPGAPWSKTFTLGPEEWPLSIHARPGSTAAKTTGVVLVPVGGLGVLFGFIGAVSSGRSENDRLALLGLGFAGAAVLATGIVLIATGRTKVTMEPAFATGFFLPLGRGVALTPAGLTF
jgi:hypothetical protein